MSRLRNSIIVDLYLYLERSSNGDCAKTLLDFEQLEKDFPQDTVIYLGEYDLIDYYHKTGLMYTEIINSNDLNELNLGETIKDFLDAANSNIEHAAVLYEMVDWQSPYSLVDELDFTDFED